MLRRSRLAMRGPQVYPYQIRFDPALQMFMQLNEETGTKAYDSTISGYVGTLSGGATWVKSARDKGIKLDGVDGLLTINNTSQYSNGCLMFWMAPGINYNSASTAQYICDSGNAVRLSTSFDYDYFNNGAMDFVFYDAAYKNATYVVEMAANKWYHLCATWGAEGMKMYLDSKLVATNTYTGRGADYATNYIFGSVHAAAAHAHYCIDEIMGFNRALSAQEIRDIYERTKPSS